MKVYILKPLKFLIAPMNVKNIRDISPGQLCEIFEGPFFHDVLKRERKMDTRNFQLYVKVKRLVEKVDHFEGAIPY